MSNRSLRVRLSSPGQRRAVCAEEQQTVGHARCRGEARPRWVTCRRPYSSPQTLVPMLCGVHCSGCRPWGVPLRQTTSEREDCVVVKAPLVAPHNLDVVRGGGVHEQRQPHVRGPGRAVRRCVAPPVTHVPVCGRESERDRQRTVCASLGWVNNDVVVLCVCVVWRGSTSARPWHHCCAAVASMRPSKEPSRRTAQHSTMSWLRSRWVCTNTHTNGTSSSALVGNCAYVMCRRRAPTRMVRTRTGRASTLLCTVGLAGCTSAASRRPTRPAARVPCCQATLQTAKSNKPNSKTAVGPMFTEFTAAAGCSQCLRGTGRVPCA